MENVINTLNAQNLPQRSIKWIQCSVCNRKISTFAAKFLVRCARKGIAIKVGS